MTQADQRTPGDIIQTLTARLDPFQSGELRKLFCTHSTFVPELTFEGAVIVLDLSAHEWGSEGILAQHIVKRMWQTAMQRRPKTPGARPCFLFVDECQYFLSAKDQQFASTSRACKALTVYRLQPSHFATLRKGGGADRMSEAIVFQAGRRFAYTGSTWTPVLFRQA